jgi:hypothetical protein
MVTGWIVFFLMRRFSGRRSGCGILSLGCFCVSFFIELYLLLHSLLLPIRDLYE